MSFRGNKMKTIVFLSAIVCMQDGFAGSASSGGGSGLRRADGKVVLLDLAEKKPDFKDSFDDPENDALRNVLESDDFKEFAADRSAYSVPVAVKEEYSFKLAEKSLRKWKPNSPTIVSAIDAMMNRTWFAMSVRDLPSDHIEGHSDILPVAFFSDREERVVFFDIRLWLDMGDLSKAGMFIHESLRRLKQEFQIDFSEQGIRDITATILLETPEEKNSLDKFQEVSKNSKDLFKISHPDQYACMQLAELQQLEFVGRLDYLYKTKCLAFVEANQRVEDLYLGFDTVDTIQAYKNQSNKEKALDLYLFLRNSFHKNLVEKLRPIYTLVPVSE